MQPIFLAIQIPALHMHPCKRDIKSSELGEIRNNKGKASEHSNNRNWESDYETYGLESKPVANGKTETDIQQSKKLM